jgi:hypothetical protein
MIGDHPKGTQCRLNSSANVLNAVAARLSAVCQRPGDLRPPRRTAPASDARRFGQVHVAAHLRHAQSLLSHHANHLQFECRVKCPAGSLLLGHLFSSSSGKTPVEVSIRIGPRQCRGDTIYFLGDISPPNRTATLTTRSPTTMAASNCPTRSPYRRKPYTPPAKMPAPINRSILEIIYPSTRCITAREMDPYQLELEPGIAQCFPA